MKEKILDLQQTKVMVELFKKYPLPKETKTENDKKGA